MSDSPRPEARSPRQDPPRDRDSHNSPDRRGRSRSRDRIPERRRGGSPHHDRRAERERDEQQGNVIYVAKLSRQTRESDLNHGFKTFGNIKTIVLKSSYAFITYEKPESATEAIARMNGTKFVNGEELLVELSGTLLAQTHHEFSSWRLKKEQQRSSERRQVLQMQPDWPLGKRLQIQRRKAFSEQELS